jgi:hypothetical protein
MSRNEILWRDYLRKWGFTESTHNPGQEVVVYILSRSSVRDPDVIELLKTEFQGRLLQAIWRALNGDIEQLESVLGRFSSQQAA